MCKLMERRHTWHNVWTPQRILAYPHLFNVDNGNSLAEYITNVEYRSSLQRDRDQMIIDLTMDDSSDAELFSIFN